MWHLLRTHKSPKKSIGKLCVCHNCDEIVPECKLLPQISLYSPTLPLAATSSSWLVRGSCLQPPCSSQCPSWGESTLGKEKRFKLSENLDFWCTLPFNKYLLSECLQCAPHCFWFKDSISKHHPDMWGWGGWEESLNSRNLLVKVENKISKLFMKCWGESKFWNFK